ncbi:hypothetical protein [Mitsuokella jalaludinii]|uniref:hypothetical protein n=1 Tax=Mitsuokella jalaludinii TaxID=187979 RepID=UPI0012DEA1D4|nr:hypothetical protein [Mitsuokella jalaludinii]MEE0482431.1 hypothetical protein [Mitsuokella jalaludinii]
MSANKKAVAGAGTPTAAEGQVVLTDTSSISILPQNEEAAQKIVMLVAKTLCRLYGEATGQQLEVVSVKRRQYTTE